MVFVFADHSESACRRVVALAPGRNTGLGHFLSTSQKKRPLLAQGDDHPRFALFEAGHIRDDKIVHGAATAEERHGERDEETTEKEFHGKKEVMTVRVI
jgi:hypothetical protein